MRATVRVLFAATAICLASAAGGIALVAFKPETGETAWARCLGEALQLLVDIPAIWNGELVWHGLRFDPKTGKDLLPAGKSRTGGMLDGAWSAGYASRSGLGFEIGRLRSSMMAWNDKLVVTSGYAVTRAKAEAPMPPKCAWTMPFTPDELSWRPQARPQFKALAMALAGDAAIYAGSVDTGATTAALLVCSAATGKKIMEAPLHAPPVYDGLAVAGGRVYLALQDGSLVCWGK
jgi:hypothetical protein